MGLSFRLISRRLQADFCLMGLALIWGSTFVVIKGALDDVSPLLLVTVRFLIAGAILSPLALTVPRGFSRETLQGGAILGTLLFLGFWLQTTGMEHTTPSRSAFITGTAVIFTPILSVLLAIRRPSVTSVCGAALATGGLWLLTSPAEGGHGFGRGEVLTLLCAICFAGHILALDHWTRRGDKRRIAFLQVATVGILGILPTIFVEHRWLDRLRFNPTPRLLVAMAIMVLLATALALFVQSIVQSWTTPTRAAVIFAMEPVFAAITAWFIDGEILAGASLVGALLIFAGMIVAELRPPWAATAE